MVAQKILTIILACLLLNIFFSPAASGDTISGVEFVLGKTNYTVNGQSYQMDAATFIKMPENRVFVPLRFLGLALGLSKNNITWDQAGNMAILSSSNVSAIFQPDKNDYIVNGRHLTMDTTPVVAQGRIYLPARYVANAFGYNATWDGKKQAVIITPAKAVPPGTGGTQTGDNGQTTGTSVPATTNQYRLQLQPVSNTAATGQNLALVVSLTNSGNQPVNGATVNVSCNSGNVQLSAGSVTTNSQGLGLISATDAAAENVIITATVPALGVTANTAVQWTSGGVTTNTNTTGNYYLQFNATTASPVAGQPVVLTVTATNSAGNPAQGVILNVTSNSAGAVLNTGTVTTNAQGQAFVVATDNNQDNVTFTLSGAGASQPQTLNVYWAPVAPLQSSYVQTTPGISIIPSTTTAATGQPVVFTITATGNYGPAVNQPISVSSTSPGAAPGSTALTTNSQGQAFFTVTDNNIENVVFITHMANNAAIMATATVSWVGAYAQQTTANNNTPIYSLQIRPSTNAAVAGQPVVLSITVTDSSGKLASGIGVNVVSSSNGVSMNNSFVTTNSQGQAYITAWDNNYETVTFTGNLVNATSRAPSVAASVQWGAQGGSTYAYSTPTVTAGGYYLSAAISASGVPAGQPVVLAVKATNGNGAPASGVAFSITSNSSNVQLTQSSSVTNSQGMLFVVATDNLAENVTLNVGLGNAGSFIPATSLSVRWY
ncbi:copper amine oxidase N-terminal domain-containing protein [Desulfotomaculum copahuensis]|uniref:Copper amine oxidase-like N-terminal domain-containing protein n=1 Tax=Desulfotomaculum copahuensis TaxID=1838280 RepID=A0A1B7LBA8_9FIRM|nr:copper amine oxidase N-terminal domain-containing protein [Desulfotomaculum copahuensis]OAT79807.1 hypothetical protein A6M21_15275 [Desulfotomaculum copahuensis]